MVAVEVGEKEDGQMVVVTSRVIYVWPSKDEEPGDGQRSRSISEGHHTVLDLAHRPPPAPTSEAKSLAMALELAESGWGGDDGTQAGSWQ